MNSRRLIRNNLLHYWKKNLLLALGVAISGAVITGALVVGDSVKYSLNTIVEKRLGGVTHVVQAGDRYFTEALAARVGEQLRIPFSSILQQESSATAAGGQARVNHVRVLGVDGTFDLMAGLEKTYGSLAGDTVIISSNLANRLHIQAGGELLLRIEKASMIPPNAPFVSDAESVVTLRATVGGIAGEDQLGRFNLKVSQTAPFNVFISRTRLQELMDFAGRVNVMLIHAGEGTGSEEIMEVVDEQFSAADAGLKITVLEASGQTGITSERVFIDDVLVQPLKDAEPAAVSCSPGGDRDLLCEQAGVRQPGYTLLLCFHTSRPDAGTR